MVDTQNPFWKISMRRRHVLFGISALCFIGVSTMLVTPLFDLTRYQLSVGQPSPRKVVARHSFRIEDREKAQAVRTARVLSIVPQFILDPRLEKIAQEEASHYFQNFRDLSSDSSPERLLEFPSWVEDDAAREAMRIPPAGWLEMDRAARTLIHEFMTEKGVLNDATEAMKSDIQRHLRYEIRYIGDGETMPPRKMRGPPELIDMKELAGYLESSIGVIYPNLPSARLLSGVLLHVIKPNLAFDKIYYQMELKKAEAEVPSVYTEYKPGDVILREGQKVSDSHLDAIREMQKSDRAHLAVTGMSAFALISLLVVLVLQYLRVYQPERLQDKGWMWFIATIFVFMLALSRIVWTLTESSLVYAFALPIPAYAMLLTIFYSPRIAMLSSPMLGFAVSLLYGSNFQLMVVHMITCIAAVFVVRHTHTMGDIVKAGMFLGLILPVAVLASHFVMIDFTVTREVGYAAAASLVSGFILVPFLTFGLVHFIPIVFGLPSDFKILELSDLNHPLLRQMLLSSPGSYQHSQTVSILSEAAAESIGANSLLARVGSYYHDIGKAKKPEYFTENQKFIVDEDGEIIGKETKEIKPSLYASVLKSHVKMGIDLAREYRLPKVIVDFIEQHHGTSLMGRIYDDALQQTGSPDDMPERESFIYPGPKPRTRETAIVMLADTVEAAVRSMTNPTPVRIEEEVHRLVRMKIDDGQLDESTLTLIDLRKVETAFVGVMASMYHTRIAYPTEDEIKRKEKEKGEEHAASPGE